MDGSETEKRIYIGDCGCVRIESKHFRITVQPETFIEILREIIAKQKKNPPFCNRLSISNNVSSSGFVSIQKDKKRKNERTSNEPAAK